MDRGGYISDVRSGADGPRCTAPGADRAGVRIITECEVRNAKRQKDRFSVETDRGSIQGDFLILACGSMAAKGTGSDGSGYELARQFDTGSSSRPGACPAEMRRKSPPESLRSPDGLPLWRSGPGTERQRQKTGELQITDYGSRASGIPGEQVCGEAFDRKQKVSAVLNFLPDLDEEEVQDLLKEQRSCLSGETAETF